MKRLSLLLVAGLSILWVPSLAMALEKKIPKDLAARVTDVSWKNETTDCAVKIQSLYFRNVGKNNALDEKMFDHGNFAQSQLLKPGAVMILKQKPLLDNRGGTFESGVWKFGKGSDECANPDDYEWVIRLTDEQTLDQEDASKAKIEVIFRGKAKKPAEPPVIKNSADPSSVEPVLLFNTAEGAVESSGIVCFDADGNTLVDFSDGMGGTTNGLDASALLTGVTSGEGGRPSQMLSAGDDGKFALPAPLSTLDPVRPAGTDL